MRSVQWRVSPSSFISGNSLRVPLLSSYLLLCAYLCLSVQRNTSVLVLMCLRGALWQPKKWVLKEKECPLQVFSQNNNKTWKGALARREAHLLTRPLMSGPAQQAHTDLTVESVHWDSVSGHSSLNTLWATHLPTQDILTYLLSQMAGDFHLFAIPSLHSLILFSFSLIFVSFDSLFYLASTFTHFSELITVTGGLITMGKCYLAAIERRTTDFLTILF